ncbi:MAG: excisionase family DNA-binding protein [Burkholderiales bacterium]|nr:excisionase family DNA-binding protein [Burkholderiales bacterium]MBH2015182.1 excisionase family DNA-binding protein [Burkholderiales bacterium]
MSQVIPLGPGARMLTTREAALRLGVSLRTVQLWVEADILPAARTPGGHRRIPHNAVEALALSTGLGGEPQARSHVALRSLASSSALDARDAPSQKARPPRAEGAEGGRGLHRLDVLLVADDDDWQARCTEALAPFSPAISLRFAETGYLALLQIGQRAPDLLITDLELPGMDGLAMLRTLERCESIAGIRVLALSHLDERELARRGGLPACAELLQLPISPEAVAARVGRWLLMQRSC